MVFLVIHVELSFSRKKCPAKTLKLYSEEHVKSCKIPRGRSRIFSRRGYTRLLLYALLQNLASTAEYQLY